MRCRDCPYGIEDFTLGDLRTIHAPFYEQEHGVSLTETNLAMGLYEQIESIEQDEIEKDVKTEENVRNIFLGKSFNVFCSINISVMMLTTYGANPFSVLII